MVVDEAVAAALGELSQSQVEIFVAGCAERMVQLFTGLSGPDPMRVSDVDTAVRLQEDLWNLDTPAEHFRRYVDCLESFQELLPSDEELADVAGIYSFYAVLSLRYAALYRCSRQVDDALKCAHACLTAMGQLDQNLQEPVHFTQEADFQRQAVVTPLAEAPNPSSFSRFRERDRAAGRKRLEDVRSRLGR
ncbi:hypothetical protein G3I77_02650 [Streptomyces sp. D2-8]|uniref:hypothetical protein n=1 Tax=Streptomyces sp. D2-8 TaxID=2707767 RepID=UPI0020BD7E5B|nr:hypothetical protein [Streptomyces sp. D2-8]MCK8431961.1 hypothetical protein [Streptomyces sp. D2-8]